LQKNPELKSVLLEETPWVLEAKTEAQQKQHIALLFDMIRMNAALESSLNKLQAMQSDGNAMGTAFDSSKNDDSFSGTETNDAKR